MSRLPEPSSTEREPDVTEEPSIPDDSFTIVSNLLPTAELCKVKTNKRIFGGKKAKEDEFPWMVLLEYKKRNFKMVLQLRR